MSLFELCRTPQVGGQSAWRDVSYRHFPSWDLNSITLNLLEILVLKSPFLPRGYPSCKVGCSEAPFSATASPWCWLPIQSLAQTSVLSCRGISGHQGWLNPHNTLINGWMNTTFYNWKMKNQEDMVGASLVAQWLRICLPVQGTRVRALVWEDPTCRGVAGSMSHNYWACASGACAPQQERPQQWEAHAPRWRVAPACHN